MILLPWEVTRVRKMMTMDYYLVLYVTALDNEVLEMIIIKPLQNQPRLGSGLSKHVHSIYPSLDTFPV